mmetsp:Transcript_12047/g.32945  ORF Transcript_12047/g.32945 Transcript_12047/m.32945 type:complete len:209 (-) Transcript_12047:2974-3600(-)
MHDESSCVAGRGGKRVLIGRSFLSLAACQDVLELLHQGCGIPSCITPGSAPGHFCQELSIEGLHGCQVGCELTDLSLRLLAPALLVGNPADEACDLLPLVANEGSQPADLIFHARLTLRGITDVLAAATSAAAVTSRQRLATVAAAPQRTESAATAASTDTLWHPLAMMGWELHVWQGGGWRRYAAVLTHACCTPSRIPGLVLLQWRW